MSEIAIEAVNLRKVFGGRTSPEFVAVDDLSLAVRRGSIFGFLGPNGAGKTTTINMLLGNVYPTAGHASLLGAPIGNTAARRRLGFLPEKFQFHEFLTAEEFLALHASLYGMDRRTTTRRIGESLELVGLWNRRKSRIREFSKGMQQRIGLAQAILSDPDLVVLDEPTSALDPIGRRDVRNLLSHLKERGKTIFLNSHLLSEIEMTCDEVAIIKAGKVVRQGCIEDLLGASTTVTIRARNLSEALVDRLRPLTTSLLQDGDTLTADIATEENIPALAATLVNGGAALLSMVPSRESLEELFIRVVEDHTPPPG